MLIYSHIIDVTAQDKELNGNELLFQLDKAPPHYAVLDREYVDAVFRGIVLDVVFGSFSQTFFYLGTQQASLQNLRQKIVFECQHVTGKHFNRSKFLHNFMSAACEIKSTYFCILLYLPSILM